LKVVAIFTTRSIVNSNIIASIIKVNSEFAVYMDIMLEFVFFVMYINWEGNNIYVGINIDKHISKVVISGRVWLGVIATKYENRTNMPLT